MYLKYLRYTYSRQHCFSAANLAHQYSECNEETMCSHCDSVANAREHYSDVIISSMASQTPVSRLFTQLFVQVQIKENIKVPRHWPFWGEFTGDRWIPRTNGQWRRKCFHLMTPSCITIALSCMPMHRKKSNENTTTHWLQCRISNIPNHLLIFCYSAA